MKHLTYAEVAEQLGYSVRTIKRMTATGELKATRKGRSVRVRQDVVDAWSLAHTEIEPGKLTLAAPTRRGAAIQFAARVH